MMLNEIEKLRVKIMTIVVILGTKCCDNKGCQNNCRWKTNGSRITVLQ